jgi:perosamine synthetase
LKGLPEFRDAACPVADGLWERGFYLPSSTKLTEAEIERVASALRLAGSALKS